MKPLKYFYIFCGIVFLAIGIVGIFIPLLPTTPFLILASFFFNKGSQKFNSWLIHHPWLGGPIQDWQRYHVIRTRYKILALALMWISWIFVILKETIPLAGKITYTLFLIGLSVYISTRKSRT